ncbi:WD-40 repeat protein (plasmid) [Nostoc sp. NIES-2111]|nr:WD-40 repeat protein [Nostoc sp. NIES-2111]
MKCNHQSKLNLSQDDYLYSLLRVGEFCYVYNLPRTSKSGLRERVMRRLRDDGFTCAAVNVAEINTDVITIEQWYVKLINKLVEEFNLQTEFNLKTWWQKNSLFSPVRCFSKFIETILLPKVNKNIVIFVDEIDSVSSLAFNSDDFFVVIRDCYNRRADKPEYERITFAFLGVSTPYDLIQDKKRTPFDIGRVIDSASLQAM